jgi:hypothetical protein
MLGLGADKMNVMAFENFRKARILGQESITRVNCIGARDLAGSQ